MTLRKLPILGQPDPSTPRDVHLVGRYALGVTWADGHGSIYPFDRLRRDDPVAASTEPPAEGAAWPREIARRPEGLRVVWADGHVSLYPYAELRGRCGCAACAGGH